MYSPVILYQESIGKFPYYFQITNLSPVRLSSLGILPNQIRRAGKNCRRYELIMHANDNAVNHDSVVSN